MTKKLNLQNFTFANNIINIYNAWGQNIPTKWYGWEYYTDNCEQEDESCDNFCLGKNSIVSFKIELPEKLTAKNRKLIFRSVLDNKYNFDLGCNNPNFTYDSDISDGYIISDNIFEFQEQNLMRTENFLHIENDCLLITPLSQLFTHLSKNEISKYKLDPKIIKQSSDQDSNKLSEIIANLNKQLNDRDIKYKSLEINYLSKLDDNDKNLAIISNLKSDLNVKTFSLESKTKELNKVKKSVKELKNQLPPKATVIYCNECSNPAPFNQVNNEDDTFTCINCKGLN